jgi:hypothetical protein
MSKEIIRGNMKTVKMKVKNVKSKAIPITGRGGL